MLKKSRAIEAALVKVLFFDYLRQTRKPGVIFASDLMQCFDRMAHPVCSLVSRRLGVEIPVLQCMLGAIQAMTHVIRTGFGDSAASYGNDHNQPLQGGGQGNGASLPLWLAISCVLIAVLESEVQGVHIYTSITLQLLVFIAIMYVDDTDILLTAICESDSIEDVFRRAQRAATVWQRAVHDSGGALRPEKCYWTAVGFKFVSGRWRYMKLNEFQGEVHVKDTNMVYQKVKRYDINKSNKGLGIFVNPDGSMGLQLKELVGKVTTWNDRLGNSSLNKKEAYIGANISIFKTVEYPLPGTSLSDTQCRIIERALYKKLMGKMGMSSKMPLEYRYGPHKFQGAALLEVAVAQLIAKLLIFLHQANLKTQLSTTLLASLEAIQIEIGSTKQFFRLSFPDFGYFTPVSWLQQLWHNVSKYNISLFRANSTLNPPRQQDFALMDKLVQAKKISREELQCINRCRLYLKVFFFSDLVSGNGTTILLEAWEGRQLHHRHSRWQWPRQTRPPPSNWVLWQMAIREIWASSETRLLKYPLGNWVHESHQVHKFVYAKESNTVYETFTNGSISAYPMLQGRTRFSKFFQYDKEVDCLPPDYVPITIHKQSKHILYGESEIERITSAITKGSLPWQEYLDSLDDEVKYLLQFANITNNGLDIARAIRNRTAIAVTDASVKKSTHTAAISWVICDLNGSFHVFGDSGCPKFHLALDSYASEAFGILVLVTVAKVICDYHAIKKRLLGNSLR